MHDAFHRARYDLVGMKEKFSKMKQDRKVLSRVFKLLLALAVNIQMRAAPIQLIDQRLYIPSSMRFSL